MNGIEKLYWQQSSTGRVFLSSPQSPLSPGYIRCATTNPREMDRIFAKIDHQVKIEHAEMTQMDYERRKDRIEKWRSDIRSRMVSADCSDFERGVLRAALAACDAREEKLNRNTVYGVSAMQTTETNPKAPGENRVIFDAPKLAVN